MNPSWSLEATTRFSFAIIGFGATPAIVGLAWVRWIRGIRRELLPWRKGVGYLAACWAIRQAPSPVAVLNRLAEKEIWDLSASDQDTVFPFLATLVRPEGELQSVFGFASQEPEMRTRLLVVVIDAANKNGWRSQLGSVGSNLSMLS